MARPHSIDPDAEPQSPDLLGELVAEINAGNYFVVPRDLVRLFKGDRVDALFLADLLNLCKRSRRRNYAGFFQCTTAYLRDGASCGWTPLEQARRLKSLARRGYVVTAVAGNPSYRVVRIDLAKLLTDLRRERDTAENRQVSK